MVKNLAVVGQECVEASLLHEGRGAQEKKAESRKGTKGVVRKHHGIVPRKGRPKIGTIFSHLMSGLQ
jgi:hypothetical protein